MSRMPLPPPSRETTAPPLRLAQACLGSMYLQKASSEEARNLFHAGSSLWAVILEVDNSEARSMEMLVAVCQSLPTSRRTELTKSNRAEYTTILVWSFGG